MDAIMQAVEHERRDWVVIALMVLLGLLCILLAGGWALRFSPRWERISSMGSNLDPNSDFLTRRASGLIEPIDASILTQPVWYEVFLTPGALFFTRTPLPPSPVPTNTFPPPVTQTPTPSPTASPTRTFMVFASPTNTLVNPTSTPAINMTPSNTPIPSADLQITIDNGVLVYSAGDTLTYTVVVRNNGSSTVVGAVVTDVKPPQIIDWSWVCTSQNNGATGCDGVTNSTADFTDTVNLPNGASIEYTFTANTSASASGNLSNTVFITVPVGYLDPLPGNNSATDTDDFLNSFPYGEIGTEPNGVVGVIPPGSSVTLMFNTPLVVGGNPGWDLVIYELPNNYGIAMDLVILQISDGSNWYTILNWGDNIADVNSNMNIDDVRIGCCEIDNRNFTTPPASDLLYPFGSGTPANPATGIVIELDGFVPNGVYYYIRIISPVTGDMDGGFEIDAIVILP
jgi:uncharacterized repeat protein (TIGR01451 family)